MIYIPKPQDADEPEADPPQLPLGLEPVEAPSSPSSAEPIKPVQKKKKKMSWLVSLLVVLAGVCVGWWTVAYMLQDWIMFPSDVAPPPLVSPPYPNAEVFKADIETGGWVEAWFVPAPGVNASNPGPVVVFFHGNAELIDHQGGIVAGYHEMGVSVLLVEYRGYGRSVGDPSQGAFRSDALTFLEQLKQRSDVRSDRIIYHGRSLGGAVAADLAGAQQPDALILESTFRSVAAMAHRIGVPWFLIKNPFATDQVISSTNAPILIFHGSEDTVIPVKHGRALVESANQSKRSTEQIRYLEFPCNHNDFPGYDHEVAYWAAIRDFLTNQGILVSVRRSSRRIDS